MSAQDLTPAEKLFKLKLLLEKKRTDFYKEHVSLVDWMNDRDLKIELLGQTKNEDNPSSKNIVDSVEKKVIEEFNHPNNKKQLESTISIEEFESIFEKLIGLLELPAGQLESQSELYLEQQLSDLLGFDILAELDGQRINHSTGIMYSEQHLKRSPNDNLQNHVNLLEAGINSHRGAFGWFVDHGEITKEAEELEKYYFSLQLYQLENWPTSYKELKSWYKFKKMIVINPAEKIAVVGVVGNIDSKNNYKYQFGGSPEIIRKGKIWSPISQGKVLLMFVDDPNNEVPLGPIYFNSLLNTENKS